MKQENHTKLFIIIAILLVIDLIFAFFNNFENTMLSDSISRLLYSIVIILIIYAMKFDVLKPKNLHLLWLAIPALLISINNFPFIAYLNDQTTLLSSQTDVYMFLLQCISIGVFEELVFRGLVLSWLLEYFENKPYAVLKSMFISSFAFGIIHLLNLFAGAGLGPTLLQVVYTMLTGLMWSAVLILTKNIWVTALLHAIYNFAGLFFPTLGRITDQWDVFTILLTIVLSVIVALFYLYHIQKIKTYQIDIQKGDVNI